MSFVFFDPYGNEGKGNWIKVAAQRFVSTSALGYTYDVPMSHEPKVSTLLTVLRATDALIVDLTAAKLQRGVPAEIGFRVHDYYKIRSIPGMAISSHPPRHLSLDPSALPILPHLVYKFGFGHFVVKTPAGETIIEPMSLP